MEGTFKWSKVTTLLIIEQYSNKKHKFRDTKIKKKDIWVEIKSEFEKRGYDITVDLLDRKFRNLKKTFTDIKDKHSHTGNGRIVWEHYEAFNEIFSDDRAINSNNTISSIDEESGELFDEVLEVVQSSTSTALGNVVNRKRALKDYRQQYLDIERSKLAKMDQLLKDIEKNTRVHEQRNNLLQQIIDLGSFSSMDNELDI